MARLIVADSDDMVNACVYGRGSENVVRSYLTHQFSRFSERYGHVGSRLLDSANTALAWVNDQSRISKIDRFLDAHNGTDQIVRENRLQRLNTIHDYREASPATIRWTMCHPVLREQAKLGNLHAFGIEDFDHEAAEDDWHRLMDGVQQNDGKVAFYQSSEEPSGHVLSEYEREVALDNLSLTELLLSVTRADLTNNEAAILPNRGW